MNWIDFMLSEVWLSFLTQQASAYGSGPAVNPFAAVLDQLTASPNAAASGSYAAPSSMRAAFTSAASQTGLSPALLQAVAHVESNDSSTAVSSAGAIGVMQLMPTTAASLGVNPYDASSNIMGGARYLAGLLHQFDGNLPLSLAAYNAGPGAVEAYGGIPPYAQTQAYVQKVLKTYQGFTV